MRPLFSPPQSDLYGARQRATGQREAYGMNGTGNPGGAYNMESVQPGGGPTISPDTGSNPVAPTWNWEGQQAFLDSRLRARQQMMKQYMDRMMGVQQSAGMNPNIPEDPQLSNVAGNIPVASNFKPQFDRGPKPMPLVKPPGIVQGKEPFDAAFNQRDRMRY